MHGSVWDIAFSNDAPQRYLFVADGQDEKVFIARSRRRSRRCRASATAAACRARSGSSAASAMDSKGNLYTGETFEGKRVQKFVKK